MSGEAMVTAEALREHMRTYLPAEAVPSIAVVRRWSRQRKIPSVPVGKYRLYKPLAVRQALESRETKARTG